MNGALGQLLAVVALAGAVLLWPTTRRRPPAIGGPGPTRTDGRGSGHRWHDPWGRDRWPRSRWRLPALPQVPVAVVIELVAAGLSAGLPPVDALDATARAIGGEAADRLRPVVAALRLGADTQVAWARSGPGYEPLVRALVLAERTGASTATALRRTASDERSARRRRAQVAARRLAVQLVLPLGLATLPAFALLAVVPVLIGLALQVVNG